MANDHRPMTKMDVAMATAADDAAAAADDNDDDDNDDDVAAFIVASVANVIYDADNSSTLPMTDDDDRNYAYISAS